MLVRQVDYFVERQNCPKKAKIMVMADLHFGNTEADARFDSRNWWALLKIALREKPDAVIIPGDIVDSAGFIEGDGKRITACRRKLTAMGRIAPVFVGIGNHDQCVTKGGELRSLDEEQMRGFKNVFDGNPDSEAESMRNVTLLDNATSGRWNPEIDIIGMTLPATYYRKYSKEYVDGSAWTIEQHIRDMRNWQISRAKFNIVMIHSPEHLDLAMLQLLPETVDLVVSGHMHNGCVPIGLYDLSRRSDKGFITPSKKPFARRCRNTTYGSGDRLITVGPVKTFSKAKFLNRTILPMEVSFIHLEKTGEEGRAIQVNRKYIQV